MILRCLTSRQLRTAFLGCARSGGPIVFTRVTVLYHRRRTRPETSVHFRHGFKWQLHSLTIHKEHSLTTPISELSITQ